MTRRLLLLYALSISYCAAQTNAAASHGCQEKTPRQERRIAMVVGIDQYLPETNLERLQFSADDASELSAALRGVGFQSELVRPHEAIKPVIRTRLSELAACFTEEEGTLLFAFSGHGGQGKDGRPYLALWESDAKDIESTGLAVEDVEKILKGSKARQKILLLDACRSIPGKPIDALDAWTSHPVAKGIYILYATEPGKKSYEDNDLRHGLFTNYVIDGLKGAEGAKSRANGMVTFGSLSRFVKESMSEFIKNGKRTYSQVPSVGGEYSVDSDFVIAGKPPARRALVIANQSYQAKCNDPGSPTSTKPCPLPLRSAVSDGRNMAEKLAALGFQFADAKNAALTDQTTEQMTAVLHQFVTSIQPDDVALIYFAGAGTLREGNPVLLGTDSVVSEETNRQHTGRRDLTGDGLKGLNLTDILTPLTKSRFGPTIVILDMCLNRVGKNRILNLLSEIKQAHNAYLLFATQVGQPAIETETGGLLTTNLLTVLNQPGISTKREQDGRKLEDDLETAMRRDKNNETDQDPYVIDHLTAPFMFDQGNTAMGARQ